MSRVVVPAQTSEEEEATRRAYQDAAAVLTTFTPSTLQPLDHAPHAAALDSFLDDCKVIYDAEQAAHFTLRDDVRAAALQRLGTREHMAAALAANPDRPDDESQQAVEALIRGGIPALDQLSRSQLGATLQALNWLGLVLPDVPDAELVRRRIAFDALLQPFRHLADAYFRGRSGDLTRLQRYIDGDWPAPDASGAPTPPLMVVGVGGIGKSTLLAKCILQLAARPEPQRVPFVYLDFDRPDILADEPVTLLIEAVAQLGAQSPGDQALFRGVRESWLRRRLDRNRQATKGRQPARDALSEAFDACEEFVRFYASSALAGRPLLAVLDTIEEVQRRSAERVGDVLAVLEHLRGASSFLLRPVLVGRVLLEEHATTALRLEALSAKAARELLESYGKLSPELARIVVGQVGRSPLALRLAAGLLNRERAAGRDSSSGVQLDRFIRAARDLLLEGQLYWRILDHVGDAGDPVRQLAHPGLVLRRITPELIREVLAEPCGLEVPDDATARALFAQLRSAVDLVSEPEPDVLEHRPDVRKVMLELLRQDKESRVRAIHTAAVRYYAHRTGLADRAEELYHRLMLNEEPALLDTRWLPGVDQFLRDAVDELPHQAQNYLAGRAPEISVPRRVRELARLEDWERQAFQRASERLSKGHLPQALAILGERRQRSPASSLYLLEAQVCASMGALEAARAVAVAGISAHSRRGSSPSLLELLLLDVRLAEQLGDLSGACASLADAQALLERYGDDQRRLTFGLNHLRLARQATIPGATDAVELAELAVRVLRPGAALSPSLLREAAIELGRYQPELLRQALSSADVELATPAQRDQLAEAVERWYQELDQSTAHITPLRVSFTSDSSERVSDALRRILGADPPLAVLEAISELLRPQTIGLVPGRSYTRAGPQISAFSAAGLRYADDLTDSLFGSSPSLACTAFQIERLGPGATSGQGELLRTVYLFNVIIAVAWLPGAEEVAALERALRGASALLYQRSGGQLAFGQVLFAPPELVDLVDLQVWPSNRLAPAAEPWGLHDQRGITPIRLGRVLWDAARGQAMPWDTPEGHGALADLWFQYALGRLQALVRRDVAEGASEVALFLPPDAQPRSYFEPPDAATRAAFPELRSEHASLNPPPLPANLPLIRRLVGFAVADPTATGLALRGAELPAEAAAGSLWVYLKHEAELQPGSSASTISAYGELQVAAAGEVELLGSEGGGTLALVSTAGERPHVWRAELRPGQAARWQPADPPRWDGALLGTSFFPQTLGARRVSGRLQSSTAQLTYNRGFSWRSGNTLIPFEFNRGFARSDAPLVLAAADGGALLIHPDANTALDLPPEALAVTQSDPRQRTISFIVNRTHWIDAAPPPGAQMIGPVYAFALANLVPGAQFTMLLRASSLPARRAAVRVCLLDQGGHPFDLDLWPLPEQLRWVPMPTLALDSRQFAAPLWIAPDNQVGEPVNLFVTLCMLPD